MLRIKEPTGALPILVRNKVVELIEKGVFTPGQQMLPEPQFAAELGVSRGTLREACRLLEEDGFIRRKPGVGTYIRMLRPSIASRSLEKEFSAFDIIKSMGLEPHVINVEDRAIEADHAMSSTLKVKVGSPLIFVQRVIKAGNKSFLFAMTIVPQSIVKKKKLKDFKGSFWHFLEKECGQRVEYGIAKIIPARADSNLARKLKIKVGSLLLLIEQVNYNREHIPLVFSRDYWVKDVVEFTIFRDRRK